MTTGVTPTEYYITTQDYVLGVDTNTNAQTLILPSATTSVSRIYIIKDIGGNASGNSITVEASGTDAIENSSSYDLTSDYESITIASDGSSNWWIIN